MLRLLVGTSVWLDTAKNIHDGRLIAAVRTLVDQRQVELLVPQVVVEEYDCNRGQAGRREPLARAPGLTCAPRGRR